MQGRRTIAAALALVLPLAASCVYRAPRPGPAAPMRKARVGLVYPTLEKVEETSAPRFPCKEFVLAGRFKVADYTSRSALLVRRTRKSFPSAQLYILDLDDGENRCVVPAPVNAAQRMDIAGYRISDTHVAWEEVSPGESDLPADKIAWRLYVASRSERDSGLGTPRLVDQGVTSARTRPLFAFHDAELVWMTNEVGVSDSGKRSPRGLVKAWDTVARRARQVAIVPNGIRTINVSGDAIVTMRYRQPAGSALAITATDVHSGRVLLEFGPPGLEGVAHYPAFVPGWLAWAVLEGGGASRAGLYLRDDSGRLSCLGLTAMDPCPAGGYLFFEREGVTSAAGERPKAVVEIRGVRLGDSKQFVLAKDFPEESGMWQTSLAASGYRTDKLVIANDQSPWVATPGDRGRTVVRAYDVSR